MTEPNAVPPYAVALADLSIGEAGEYFSALSSIVEGFRRAGSLRDRLGHGRVVVEMAEGYADVLHKHFLLGLRLGRHDHLVESLARGAYDAYAGGPGDPRNQAARHLARQRAAERGRRSEDRA